MKAAFVGRLSRMIFTGTVIVGLGLALLAAITAVGVRLIERAHPPSGKFIEVAGGRLHVVELDRREPGAREGLPIVLLHGASGNLEDMRISLGERLAARHRVILVDRPGLGWSEFAADAQDFSSTRQAAMISEMLEHLDVGRAIVVGHSLAGTVAMAIALDDPYRVAGLVLIAPVLQPWSTGIAWYYTLATTPYVGPLFAWTLALPAGMVLLEPGVTAVFAPQPAPPDYAARAAIALVLRPKSFLANARDVAALHAFVTAQTPRYARSEVPTVIITGDQDSAVSADIHARATAKIMPSSRLVVLPGIGHMPHHVATDSVVKVIEELEAKAEGQAKPH